MISDTLLAIEMQLRAFVPYLCVWVCVHIHTCVYYTHAFKNNTGMQTCSFLKYQSSCDCAPVELMCEYAGEWVLLAKNIDVLAKWSWWLDEAGGDDPAFSCVFPPFLVCPSIRAGETKLICFLKVHFPAGLAPWLGSLQGLANASFKLKGGAEMQGDGRVWSPQEYWAVGLVWLPCKTYLD